MTLRSQRGNSGFNSRQVQHMTTLFEKIIAGELPSHKIYEDDEFYGFLDINPLYPGHTLIVPKKVHELVYDMPDALYEQLFVTAKRVAKAIQEATGSHQIAMVVEGLHVPHAHLHLVPVKEGAGLRQAEPRRADDDELADMAARIRQRLKQAGSQ